MKGETNMERHFNVTVYVTNKEGKFQGRTSFQKLLANNGK